MRGKIVLAGLILTLSGGAIAAQDRGASTTQDDIYCSGTITSESVPRDTYVITGEESNYKNTFQQGDYVYINKGSSQGVKVGDQFSVIRATTDPTDIEWTKWQFSILKKIGTMWEDEGRLRVVVAQPNVSIAQIVNSCNYMQRGDIVLIDTGWWKYVNTDVYEDHPVLTAESSEWLIAHGAKLVGVDSSSPDEAVHYRSKDFNYPVHHTLLSNGVLVAEHLTNLSALAGQRLEIMFLGINIVSSDGAPARVVARPYRPAV